ncbi:hypothetical protein [Streptomyces pulveraceus]|uniref:Uncharacterized protein n=1 Tax=Streptomyces pulveraceus TaxID=68258 RepID=A0ABW1GI14_9ACTN
MSAGWLLLIAISVIVVGMFLIGMCRGAANHARSQTRQDLVRLGTIPMIAKQLTEVNSLPTYAFVAPFAEGRSHPFGWLWALTYRRARRAASLPAGR